MTTFLIRTDIDSPPSVDDAVLLDWAPGLAATNIDCDVDFFRHWRPAPSAADLFLAASAVFCVDKIAPRLAASDAWTRTLALHLPLSVAPPLHLERLESAVRFLTGDLWSLHGHIGTTGPLDALPDVDPALLPALDHDAVCLFSGGLDSLCGAIDLLETNPTLRLALLGWYDGGQSTSKQQQLYNTLAQRYGADRLSLHRLWLRPAPANPRQAHPSPSNEETTTRARSLLFLTAAIALASAAGPNVPVYLPENGYVALNVPLTRARVGSASTRTTHPYFLELLTTALVDSGITNPLINPYGLQTKGEMMRGSRNPGLLHRLAPDTVSCSHPEAARMQERPQGNCGYCFPCLIRRAALDAAGWDEEDYPWDVLSDGDLLDEVEKQRGADLRAVLNGIFDQRPDSDLLRNARLPRGSHRAHLSTWRRGNQELEDWFRSRAAGRLQTVIAALA